MQRSVRDMPRVWARSILAVRTMGSFECRTAPAGLRSCMGETSATVAKAPTDRRPPLRQSIYRSLFYGWMFRDADSGTALERALALRHNQAQARWMPVYLVRWLAIGFMLWPVEQASEAMALPALSVVLALGLIYVAMYLLLATVFWAFLRGGRHRGGGS